MTIRVTAALKPPCARRGGAAIVGMSLLDPHGEICGRSVALLFGGRRDASSLGLEIFLAEGVWTTVDAVGDAARRFADRPIASDPFSFDATEPVGLGRWRPLALTGEAESIRDDLYTGRFDRVQKALWGEPGDELARTVRDLGLDPVADLAARGVRLEAGRGAFAACPGDASAAALAWYGDTGSKGEIRRQAAESYPVLAGLIAGSAGMRRAVDLRISPAEAWREALPSLGPAGASRLGRIAGAGATQERLGETFEDEANDERRPPLSGPWTVGEAVRWLDRAAEKKRGIDIAPNCDRQWSAFTAIWSGLIMPYSSHFDAPMIGMLPPGSDWAALREQLGRDLGLDAGRLPDRADLNAAVIDSAVLCEMLARDVVFPVALDACERVGPGMDPPPTRDSRKWAALTTLAREAAAGMLMPTGGGGPLRACARLAVRGHHGRLAELDDARRNPRAEANEPEGGSPYGSRAWEAPWPNPTDGALRFLASQADLEREGREMEHCIGRAGIYCRTIWSGEAAAARVAAKGREATVFIRLLSDGRPRPRAANDRRGSSSFSIEMHGRRNRAPHSACIDAVDRFLSAAHAGDIPVRTEWQSFARWTRSAEGVARRNGMSETCTPRGAWEALCGTPLDRGTGRRLWEVWRAIAPKARGIDDPAALVWRQGPAQRLLRALSPETYEAMSGRAPSAGRHPAREPDGALSP